MHWLPILFHSLTFSVVAPQIWNCTIIMANMEYVLTLKNIYVCFAGVKRKRIRGDVWRFKEVCGEIFAATRL